MATESDKRKTPRVRVRIPSMTGDGTAGKGDGAPSVGPGQIGDAASILARGRIDDSARRLTFELEIGELPNVLQFLSTDRRSGKLDLTVRNQPNAGYVFFDDGAVYLARYRNFEGVEALARVVNAGRVRAIFTNGIKAGERNVDIPVSSLLLEVLVRADELAAGGESEESAPRFLVSTKGSPVAEEAAGPTANLPPPPTGEAALHESDQDAMPQWHKRGPQTDADPEEEEEPGPQHYTFRNRPSRTDTADGPAPRKGGFRRVALVFIELVVLAAVIGGGYWVYDRFFARSGVLNGGAIGRRTGRVNVHGEELDEALLKTWLKSAGRALTEKRYDEAGRLLQQVLAADPGNRQALELRDTLDRADAPAIAGRLAGIAEFKIGELASLEDHDWASSDVLRAQSLLRSASELRASERFEGAVKAYRAALAVADEIAERRAAFERAVQKHRLAEDLRKTAEQAGSVDRKAKVWLEAMVADREALEFFAAHQFEQAEEAWSRAGLLFQRNAARAADMQEVERLGNEFRLKLAAAAGIKLSEEANRLAGEASGLADEAEKLAQGGDVLGARRKWGEALKVLDKASSKATGAEHSQQHRKLVETGKAANAVGDWKAAKEAFTSALAIPGFADDAEALRALFEADKGILADNMNAAVRDGRWQDAKLAAEELQRIDAGNQAAREVLQQARKELVVRLTIEALHAGKPVVGARTVIGGESEARLLPDTIELDMDADYHLRVFAPPRGNVYFETYTTIYEAEKPGADKLVVEMKAAGGPEKTRQWRVPGINMEMAYIRPGIFDRGSERRTDEQPVHSVTISRHFWMGVAEVTNGQYRDFLEGSGYDGRKQANSRYLRHFDGASAMSDERNHPVCYVSWKNAMAFCEWLTIRERKGARLPQGYAYRLPTEAEWEYCASAGGELGEIDLDLYAWYMKNSKANQMVQQLQANGWGLHDMLGNVWELCYDYYGPYEPEEVADPVGPRRGVLRVMRGGSHSNPGDLCRPTYRSSIGWTDARANVGFRVVLGPTFEELRKSMTPGAIVRSGDDD